MLIFDCSRNCVDVNPAWEVDRHDGAPVRRRGCESLPQKDAAMLAAPTHDGMDCTVCENVRKSPLHSKSI